MTRFLFAVAAVYLFGLPVSAHADSIFNISNGTLSDGGTFTGTFTLDSAEFITSAYLVVIDHGATYVDYVLEGQAFESPATIDLPLISVASIQSAPNLLYSSYFEFSVQFPNGSLPVLNNNFNSKGHDQGVFDIGFGYSPTPGGLVTGGVVSAASVTPEPSGLALIATGALALLGATRRRFRRV